SAVERTLPERLLGPNRADAYAEALSSRSVVDCADDALLSDVEELPRDRGRPTGNGRVDSHARPIGDLSGALGCEPLSVRLDGASADGSASLSLPSIDPVGIAR